MLNPPLAADVAELLDDYIAFMEQRATQLRQTARANTRFFTAELADTEVCNALTFSTTIAESFSSDSEILSNGLRALVSALEHQKRTSDLAFDAIPVPAHRAQKENTDALLERAKGFLAQIPTTEEAPPITWHTPLQHAGIDFADLTLAQVYLGKSARTQASRPEQAAEFEKKGQDLIEEVLSRDHSQCGQTVSEESIAAAEALKEETAYPASFTPTFTQLKAAKKPVPLATLKEAIEATELPEPAFIPAPGP